MNEFTDAQRAVIKEIVREATEELRNANRRNEDRLRGALSLIKEINDELIGVQSSQLERLVRQKKPKEQEGCTRRD